MYRKLLALFLAVVLCLSFAGCDEGKKGGDTTTTTTTTTTDTTTTTADTVTSTTLPAVDPDKQGTGSTPLLYKVTDGDGDVLWLFGSIHVGREEFYPLPDYVMDAFEGSDALAVEFDVVEFEKNPGDMMSILQKLCYLDGTTIKDHIDEATYDSAVKILTDSGYYNALLDYYIPALWSSFIDECTYTKMGIDLENGIDKYLINLAYEADKEVLDVESAEYQFGMLADYSDELQAFLLRQSVESYDKTDELDVELDKMAELWAAGDEEAFEEYLLTEDDDITDPEELALYEEYNESMIVVRNGNMTDYAVDILEEGREVFMCVGAGHVGGEGGIADRLHELGYTVSKVN